MYIFTSTVVLESLTLSPGSLILPHAVRITVKCLNTRRLHYDKLIISQQLMPIDKGKNTKQVEVTIN